MSSRIGRDDLFLSIARVVAMRATCLRASVGAVIVKDNNIISIGYNGSLPGEPHCLDEGCLMQNGHCVRTNHAESNAVARAAKAGRSTDGATLYMSGWTLCPTCEKLCKAAGIVRFVCDEKGPQRPGGYE